MLIGLHGRSNGRLVKTDLDCARTARIQAYKLMSTASYSDYDSLKTINPNMFVMVRLFEDLSKRMETPADFVNGVLSDLSGFHNKGVRYFEVANEVNLKEEGWQTSWSDGSGFGNWFMEVCSRIKFIFPDVKLGWPGLSPGGALPNRMPEFDFLSQAGSAVTSADWIGCHCYWASESTMFDPAAGGNYVNYTQRYPGKLIYITEFSNPTPGIPKSVKGNQYVKYYQSVRRVEAAISFVSSSPLNSDGNASFPNETWSNEDGTLTEIPGIVGRRTDMTNMAIGMDVSGNNQIPSLMHYDVWSKQGVCYLFIEVATGTDVVKSAAEHRKLARAQGLLTGPYIYLRHRNDIAAQARLLISLRDPADELPNMLDIEDGTLTASDIRLFCDTYDSLTTVPLIIYTGKPVWDAIMVEQSQVNLSWYLKYELFIAAYPYDSPKGVPVPMDPVSVALRSNPPVNKKPAIPLPWTKYLFWQHSGQGSKDGYNGFIDCDVASLTEVDLRKKFVSIPIPIPPVQPAIPETRMGDKLCIGQVANGKAIDFAKSANDQGIKLVSIFGMDNGGLAIDGNPLVNFTITRIVQGTTDAAPGMDDNPSDAKLKAMAVNQIIPYSKMSDAEKKAPKYIIPWNEPRPEGIPGYLALTRLQQYTVDAAKAAGFKILAYAFNAGTPEVDEMDAMWSTGINQYLIANDCGISIHIGVLGQPGVPDEVSDRMDDRILGVTLTNPNTGFSRHLDNADALVTRYRFMVDSARRQGIQIAPMFATECYPALHGIATYPLAEILRRYSWLSDQLVMDPEVPAVYPYALGSTGVGLPENDHVTVWPGLISQAVKNKNRINLSRKDTPMDAQTILFVNQQTNIIDDASKKIRDAVNAPQPVGWDLIPDGLINPSIHTSPTSTSLPLYKQPSGTPYTVRIVDPATYTIDVYEKKTGFLRVTDGLTVIWTQTVSVKPPK